MDYAIWKSWKFYFALVLLIVATILSFCSSAFIRQYFPDRQPIPDLLFNILPYYPWLQDLSDIANIFSITTVAYYFFWGRSRQLPYALMIFAVAVLLRDIIVVLNPFGGPLGNYVHYGLTTIHQNGQFTSGHTAIVMLAYFLVDKKESPILKTALLVSIVVEIIALLLSHGHYTIDIIGGFLLSYVVFYEMQKYKKYWVIQYPTG